MSLKESYEDLHIAHPATATKYVVGPWSKGWISGMEGHASQCAKGVLTAGVPKTWLPPGSSQWKRAGATLQGGNSPS